MSEKRFARQHIYEPPPEFPLASPCTGIVHHLSGPNRHARTQTFRRSSWSVDGAGVTLPTTVKLFALHGFATHQLAYMLDSLVRVSRRAGWKPSASISTTQFPKDRATFTPRSTRRHGQGIKPHAYPGRRTHADQHLALTETP